MSFKHDYNPSSNAGQDQSISLPRTISIVISALILGGITGILLFEERGDTGSPRPTTKPAP